jgi:hypothetical protein
MPRSHYRIIVKEAGYPLSNLRGTHELFAATRDVHNGHFCFSAPFMSRGEVTDTPLAIRSAYEKCGTLHRDVSLGNIVLFPVSTLGSSANTQSPTSNDDTSATLLASGIPSVHASEAEVNSAASRVYTEREQTASSFASKDSPEPFDYRARKGLLIDWELSSPQRKTDGGRGYEKTVSGRVVIC